MQQQMAIISPLMFAFFAFQFPLGLALYWNVFGIFGIMQQLRVNQTK
jgi:membrane protein insertase Oxa1/YidC/SpoIIIJ